MRRSHRILLALVSSVLAVAALAWLITSVSDLHDRLARVSTWLAAGVVAAIVLTAAACGVVAARLFWALATEDRPSKPVEAPTDVVEAATAQAEAAKAIVARVGDAGARQELEAKLEDWKQDRESGRFHVVVFGTGSAGKTSLINALLGREVGATEAVMGTTKAGEFHEYRVKGLEGELVLTDTPGLSEIGLAGADRESRARELAIDADLLLFVVDHDLTRAEFDPLVALLRQGKRSIVVFNKKDRFPDADRIAIIAKLKERLSGLVPPEDVVAVAAAPRPVQVRVRGADGTTRTEMEAEPIDLAALLPRIQAVLAREGGVLRAGNLLLRAHLISRSAQEQVQSERDRRAQAVIDRFQWITAGAVFANPLPALDLMAAGAVQFQMITELGAVYEQQITIGHAKMIGGQMVQMLLKLGMVEAATSLVAGLFKSTLVGYAAGGGVQALSMAYLTHVSGQAFAEYFRRGQDWGDGGMQAALVRQFDLHSRAEFLQEFARQAVDRVLRRQTTAAGPSNGGSGSR